MYNANSLGKTTFLTVNIKKEYNLIMSVSCVKPSRILAYALAMLFVLLVTFSEYYVHRESSHECSGKHCPVCEVLNQGNNLVSSILKSEFLKSLIFVPLLIEFGIAAFYLSSFKNTLVDVNIRLNE